MLGDLHVHTNISDGSFSTEEVIRMAKKKGITHIAITNHDTMRGLEEAVELGNQIGVKVIPGIEISAYDFENNRRVHLLGYNFKLDGLNINQLCYPTLIKRNIKSEEQVSKLLYEGYEIDLIYLRTISRISKIIYKQHIMDALVKKHYTDSIYSDLYRRLFKNNGVCAGEIKYVDVYDAVEAIQKDGGVAVLAHPAQFNSFDIIPKLIEKGIWGIEINHHSNSKEDQMRILEIANKYNLQLTGGSDFHGKYSEKPIDLGDITTPSKVLNYL